MKLNLFLEELRRLLPPEWNLEVAGVEVRWGDRIKDAVLTITAPDGTTGEFLVELRRRISARQAADVGDALSKMALDGEPPGILFTRYASRMAQERLRAAGVSYLDLTGNTWIRLPRPAVFIEREGAKSDPDPPRRRVQSLKGAKAARIVRGLCDWRSPVGVRELARRTQTDAGYVSRVLSFLEDEDIVVRGTAGDVAEVRWRDLLQRWGADYSLTGANRSVTFLAPRGLSHLQERLAVFDEPYAVTGSFAVPPDAQVAPGRTLSCYVSAPESAAERLDLRPADAGVNVLLLEPFDEVVFQRTRNERGQVLVALSQCAIDLLTGSGREPAQAEALMNWMVDHEDAWRA